MRNNWPIKKLGEVCILATGGTPSKSHPEYFGGSIKWLVSGDINKREIYDCDGTITEEGMKNSNARILPKNCILIALNGQGKTRGTVAILRTEATCNQSLVAIIPNPFLLPEFLYHNLNFRYQELRNITGATDRRGLSMKIIREIEISLPPFEEQKKIVKKLEKILATTDVAVQSRLKSLEEVKLLTKSALSKALNNTKTKVESSINDFIDRGFIKEVQDGNHGEKHPKASEYVNEGVPFLFANHIKNQQVLYEGAPKLTKKVISRLRVGFSKKNDVLLTTKGTVGETAVIPVDCILSPQVTYYRVDNLKIIPKYLSLSFQSDNFQAQLSIVKKQATRDYIGITKQKNLTIEIPSVQEQRKIVAYLDGLSEKVQALQKLQQEQLQELEVLKQSVLHKAFQGEL